MNNQILTTIKRTDTLEDGVLVKRIYTVDDLPGLWDCSGCSHRFTIEVYFGFSGGKPSITPKLTENQSFTLDGLWEYHDLLETVFAEVCEIIDAREERRLTDV